MDVVHIKGVIGKKGNGKFILSYKNLNKISKIEIPNGKIGLIEFIKKFFGLNEDEYISLFTIDHNNELLVPWTLFKIENKYKETAANLTSILGELTHKYEILMDKNYNDTIKSFLQKLGENSDPMEIIGIITDKVEIKDKKTNKTEVVEFAVPLPLYLIYRHAYNFKESVKSNKNLENIVNAKQIGAFLLALGYFVAIKGSNIFYGTTETVAMGYKESEERKELFAQIGKLLYSLWENKIRFILNDKTESPDIPLITKSGKNFRDLLENTLEIKSEKEQSTISLEGLEEVRITRGGSILGSLDEKRKRMLENFGIKLPENYEPTNNQIDDINTAFLLFLSGLYYMYPKGIPDNFNIIKPEAIAFPDNEIDLNHPVIEIMKEDGSQYVSLGEIKAKNVAYIFGNKITAEIVDEIQKNKEIKSKLEKVVQGIKLGTEFVGFIFENVVPYIPIILSFLG